MSNHMGWGIGLIGNWEPEGFWFQSQLQIKKLESGLVGEVTRSEHRQSAKIIKVIQTVHFDRLKQ